MKKNLFKKNRVILIAFIALTLFLLVFVALSRGGVYEYILTFIPLLIIILYLQIDRTRDAYDKELQEADRNFVKLSERLAEMTASADGAINQEKEEVLKENILQAVVRSTNELLSNNRYEIAVKKSLVYLGTSVGADRAYYFENNFNEDGSIKSFSEKAEWCVDGTPSLFEAGGGRDINYDAIKEIHASLNYKKPFKAVIGNLKENSTTAFLKGKGIKSIYIIPVWVNNIFYGFVE
jgi:hypothetical protein